MFESYLKDLNVVRELVQIFSVDGVCNLGHGLVQSLIMKPFERAIV